MNVYLWIKCVKEVLLTGRSHSVAGVTRQLLQLTLPPVPSCWFLGWRSTGPSWSSPDPYGLKSPGAAEVTPPGTVSWRDSGVLSALLKSEKTERKFSWLQMCTDTDTLACAHTHTYTQARAHSYKQQTMKAAVPVVEFIHVQSLLIRSHLLHEIRLSRCLRYKLSKAWNKGLQQHANVRATVGLQYLCCHGIKCGLLQDIIRWTGGVCRGGPQDANLRVSGPERNQADANWRVHSSRHTNMVIGRFYHKPLFSPLMSILKQVAQGLLEK